MSQFCGGGVRKLVSFQQTSRKVDTMRWQISAFISILRRTNKGESGLPACPNATRASDLTLFCFLTDVINESKNSCDARGIAFPRHFFCHVHSSAMLRQWKSIPGDWLLRRECWSAAEMEIGDWRIWRIPSNFPVVYWTIRITVGEKLSWVETLNRNWDVHKKAGSA